MSYEIETNGVRKKEKGKEEEEEKKKKKKKEEEEKKKKKKKNVTPNSYLRTDMTLRSYLWTETVQSTLYLNTLR